MNWDEIKRKLLKYQPKHRVARFCQRMRKIYQRPGISPIPMIPEADGDLPETREDLPETGEIYQRHIAEAEEDLPETRDISDGGRSTRDRGRSTRDRGSSGGLPG